MKTHRFNHIWRALSTDIQLIYLHMYNSYFHFFCAREVCGISTNSPRRLSFNPLEIESVYKVNIHNCIHTTPAYISFVAYVYVCLFAPNIHTSAPLANGTHIHQKVWVQWWNGLSDGKNQNPVDSKVELATVVTSVQQLHSIQLNERLRLAHTTQAALATSVHSGGFADVIIIY